VTRYRWVLTIFAILGLATGAAVWLFKPDHPTEAIPEQVDGTDNGPDWFVDVTARTGIDFTYRNGEEAKLATILESLGGGVAAFDFDNDGRLDLFFTGGGSLDGKVVRGRPCRLYRNLGDWKFEDVTERCGLADATNFYSHGVAVADYDRDGFADLLVTGWNRLALFHNVPRADGGRAFLDVSAASKLPSERWPTAAAWADFDGDGFPDLYVCHYLDWTFANDPDCLGSGSRDVCAPQRFQPLQHRIYRNAGNGAFEDRTAAVALRADGKGLGALALDLDADARPDLYVANDAGDNFLYRNLGGFRFEEIGQLAGVATDDNGLYNGSMGVDAADYDGTGRPSIVVTNFQGEIHALYRNLDGRRFRHVSQSAGLGRLGRSYVGFGVVFADFDRDGWEDLAIANGHVLLRPTGSTHRQRPILLRNEEHESRRQFREPPGKGGVYFRSLRPGRGLAVADLDNDGWPDLVVCHQNEPAAILRNAAGEALGKNHHWIRLKLIGKAQRDLVGTTATLEVDGRVMTRFVKGGGSYLSANDPRIDFGLGDASKIGTLTVRWSYGGTQRFDGLATDREYTIGEGEPLAK
jgi:enediyne biosynthesis protein E4